MGRFAAMCITEEQVPLLFPPEQRHAMVHSTLLRLHGDRVSAESAIKYLKGCIVKAGYGARPVTIEYCKELEYKLILANELIADLEASLLVTP